PASSPWFQKAGFFALRDCPRKFFATRQPSPARVHSTSTQSRAVPCRESFQSPFGRRPAVLDSFLQGRRDKHPKPAHRASAPGQQWLPTSFPRHDTISTTMGMPTALSTRRPQSQRRRSEEHTSELQSRSDLVCRLLLEK